ncbi:COPII coat assembly protein SEC16-like isoform X2 [Magnolia sinica]|uniref:COPII coat assembly protein SEC16-like isoform X2 n=1 Tax=Magnolia sinica TaxID=86752 RepID=UPI002659CE6A|nr:COPII coat assembly protein SEC16-like isoform X2 [Magnolia sinica]
MRSQSRALSEINSYVHPPVRLKETLKMSSEDGPHKFQIFSRCQGVLQGLMEHHTAIGRWPQFRIPPFKIVQLTCLKQVRIGEEISLVRVKVPWPVSAREAIVHFFELDCFDDDLIIVLINTVSDKEHIDVRTHGFTSDGIPEAKDIVRIDMVGAMALQKVSSNKSYFRTIANFDIKLDFIPATFINFVSRQLIGSGFKLYQKAVASVAQGDDDFRKALEEKAMFIRIRENLKSHNKGKDAKVLDYENSTSVLTEEQVVETGHADTSVDIKPTMVSEIEDETEQVDHLEVDQLMHQSSMNEIPKQHHEIEDETEQVDHLEVDQLMCHSSTNEISKQHHEIEDQTEQVDHLEVDLLMHQSSMNEIPKQHHEIEDETEQVDHLEVDQLMCHSSTNEISKQHHEIEDETEQVDHLKVDLLMHQSSINEIPKQHHETEDETEQVDHLEVDQLMCHSSMNEIAKQHHEIEDETEQVDHLEVDLLMHQSSMNEIPKQHHEIEDETEQVDHLEVDQLTRHSSMNEIAKQHHEIEDETELVDHLEVDPNEIGKQYHEIEDETKQADHLEVDQLMRHSSKNEMAEQRHVSKEGYFISPEVEQALSILDKAIALARGCGQNVDYRIEPSSTKQKIVNLDRVGKSGSTSSDEAQVWFDARDAPNMDDMDKPSGKTHDDSTIHNFRGADTDLPSSEADNSQKELASLNSNHTISDKIQEEVLSSSHNGVTNTSMLVAPMPQRINGVHKIVEIRGNGAHESSLNGIGEKHKQKKNKKRRICCLL